MGLAAHTRQRKRVRCEVMCAQRGTETSGGRGGSHHLRMLLCAAVQTDDDKRRESRSSRRNLDVRARLIRSGGDKYPKTLVLLFDAHLSLKWEKRRTWNAMSMGMVRSRPHARGGFLTIMS